MPWFFLSLFVVHIVLNVFYRNKSVSMQCFTIKTKTHITLGNVFDDDDDDERSRNFHCDGLGLEIREKQRKKSERYIHIHIHTAQTLTRPFLLHSPVHFFAVYFGYSFLRFSITVFQTITLDLECYYITKSSKQASERGHAVAICLC